MTIIHIRNEEENSDVRTFMDRHMQQHPFIFSNERKYRVARHVAFWAFWWIFQGVLYSFVAANSYDGYFRRLPVSIAESLIYLVNHIFLAYGLMYFVLPRFLLRQRYWHTAFWTLIFFLLTACISVVIAMFVIDPFRAMIYGASEVVNYRPAAANIFLSLMAGLRGGITIGGIAAAIKLMKYWYLKEQRNLQLQKENVAAQLQLLKAQVHPHFLFNTLNNIYSYTQNTSPVAAKMVAGLSDLLRFMLYEGERQQVPLALEIKMVRDYINLEQIRYGNKLELHLDLPENTYNLQIAPLLLLPLVENCFKHGTSHVLEQPWINMQIQLQGRQLQMKLMNGKANHTNPDKDSSGIGIQNVRKRLGMIYPGKHEMNIINEEEVFIINLKIELEQKKDLQSSETISIPNHA